LLLTTNSRRRYRFVNLERRPALVSLWPICKHFRLVQEASLGLRCSRVFQRSDSKSVASARWIANGATSSLLAIIVINFLDFFATEWPRFDYERCSSVHRVIHCSFAIRDLIDLRGWGTKHVSSPPVLDREVSWLPTRWARRISRSLSVYIEESGQATAGR
jgi:hypothetical protein